MKRFSLILIVLITIFFLLGAYLQEGEEKKDNQSDKSKVTQQGVIVTNNLELDFSKHKVTFIELGADRCIPCRMMQPIMKEIAEEFAGQVQVVFYDVWKDPKPARKYSIRLIPTQVFIDQEGKEFFRHVGFFPKEEILKILKQKGVN
ncbi:MAG: thioredoxin family protein [Candidatus Aminicenantes bacterium]|nr:thioredoxin family protein [Candidatus Aminicenantes bacterium]